MKRANGYVRTQDLNYRKASLKKKTIIELSSTVILQISISLSQVVLGYKIPS